MSNFHIDNFYLYFQGIVLFQVAFFGMLFLITRRKEILYYCLFIFCSSLYFFINAPYTFFRIEEYPFFDTSLYLHSNILLLLSGSFFYLKFLKEIFIEDFKYQWLSICFRITFYLLPVLFVVFLVLPYFNISRSFVFYTINLINIPAGIAIIYINIPKKSVFNNLVTTGILCNIAGSIITVYMIFRYNSGQKDYIIDEYPLLFLRFGILADVFLYQLAILKKWHNQETQLAVKDLQSELDLANLRNHISRELHDDIGTTLSKINLQSFMTLKNIKNPDDHIANSLNSIQSSVQETMQRIKEIIWSSEEEATDIQFTQAVAEYARSMCLTKNIVYLDHINSDVEKKLTIKNKLHLSLMCKEAINNAIKYSNCKTLEISTNLSQNQIFVSISDDGDGFDTSTSNTGFGLKNMKYRAKTINASTEIDSVLSNGTKIIIKLPITT